MNETTKTLILTGAVILGAFGGMLIGHSVGVKEGNSADITVLPCSAWADNAKPKIPPHTFSGACAEPDGSLSVPVNGLPSIPRCKNDDFNDGTQDRCWTETVQGKVIVISRDDKVVS